MLSQSLLHSISRLPNRKPAKEFAYDTKEIFDKPDSAKLKNKKAFHGAGKYLQENQFVLSVIACSDEKGDSDKLRLPTEARAKVVRDYLTQNYELDDKRVKTIGLGKTKTVDENFQARRPCLPDLRPALIRIRLSNPANLQRGWAKTA